jgi:hypothetical protein
VAGKDLGAWGIYQGNPAVLVKKREIGGKAEIGKAESRNPPVKS